MFCLCSFLDQDDARAQTKIVGSDDDENDSASETQPVDAENEDKTLNAMRLFDAALFTTMGGARLKSNNHDDSTLHEEMEEVRFEWSLESWLEAPSGWKVRLGGPTDSCPPHHEVKRDFLYRLNHGEDGGSRFQVKKEEPEPEPDMDLYQE